MSQLKPWYAVAIPHEDIRKGRLEESVFAANLWAVVQGTAPEIYLDPVEFYHKTFMTVGLRNILLKVAKALKGDADAGDRIISLQTTFGGGKTHTLIALWHMAKNLSKILGSDNLVEIKNLLEGHVPDKPINVAVFTNHTCDATQGRQTPDGVHTRTLWGEIALQLGGRELYEKVRINDETQRVPQGIFLDILSETSPCLILLDEIADYCVGAAAVPVGDTTLADQTISFIQQLEEAVAQVPGAVVVATLPASRLEVAQSEKGQELFSALERRFHRLGADIKPVGDDEIYEIVRARLFESINTTDEPDYPDKVAKVYQGMYASHAGEVPPEASKTAYREQIRRAFPFHPLVIDALYTRWGSHPDFQRTRGVLRLLASIVGDLWSRREGNTQTQHLIQPCHIRWSIDALHAALTRLWGPAYEAVVAGDVLGERSNAGIIDEERGGDYRREKIAQGLASAILLGSFGGKGHRVGFSAKELKLATARYGLNWNYTDGALLELDNRCFYLHSTSAAGLGKRYWFSTKPRLTKLLVQYRQQIGDETFDDEILETLRMQVQKGATGQATWRIIVNPEIDLPEQKSLTLLILHPSLTWTENGGGKDEIKRMIFQLSERCGAKDRIYRNTLLFLVTNPRGLTKLYNAYRERAALRGIKSDYWDQLDADDREELSKRLESAERASVEALGPAYTVVCRVYGHEIETCILQDARTNFQEHLDYIWNTLIEEEEWILRRIGSVMLQKAGLIPEEGGIRIRDAIDAFLRFTDKPMIASKEAITSGLEMGCRDGIVGIGRGTSLSNLMARYCNEHVSIDPNEEGLWIIPPFKVEKREESVAEGDTSSVVKEISDKVQIDKGISAEPLKTKGTVRRFKIKGAVPVESYPELFRCFVSPAVRMNLKKLHLGIEFEMEVGEGNELDPNDPTLKAMKEAASQLGLDFEIEE